MNDNNLEVVELNKEEKKIVIEEDSNKGLLLIRHRKMLLIILLLSLILIGLCGYYIFSNMDFSDNTITESNIDFTIGNDAISINGNAPITGENAFNQFNNTLMFKQNGEILLVKTVENDQFIIKFYSDYTAVKTDKKTGLITRITSALDNTYGISDEGTLNIKAKVLDIKLTSTNTYPWGVVEYYSDGSAMIKKSKVDLYVRNGSDVKENYISSNKVSYSKEIKNINNTTIEYFYDGTMLITKDGNKYVIRNNNDIDNNINFVNNNQASIWKTVELNNNVKIEYYKDGSAIIYSDNNKLSVRKSNSIVIKDNALYEIVDSYYVEISSEDNNVIYYTNGGAVVKNYNGKYYYVSENSNIKKNALGVVTAIGSEYEEFIQEKKDDKSNILVFNKTSVVKTKEYIAIVPNENVIYNSDGTLKEVIVTPSRKNANEISISNNTNDIVTYRLVIKNSDKTNMDVSYLRYQVAIGEKIQEVKRLDSNVWKNDDVSDALNVHGENFILVEKTLRPLESDKLMVILWADYDTIPNSQQDKYFYGTVQVYAYQESRK